MSEDPKNPTTTSHNFDFSEFKEYEIDLAPGERQGMKSEHDGFKDVRDEIVDNQAEYGDRAGITAGEFAEFEKMNARIERLDAVLPALAKRYEVLLETRAFLADKRENFINNSAGSIDKRAKHEPVLLAKYQKTRAYRSEAAAKASKTRRKNAAAAQAEQAAAGAQAGKPAAQASAAQVQGNPAPTTPTPTAPVPAAQVAEAEKTPGSR